MSLLLPQPPKEYDFQDQAQTRAAVEREDRRNRKTDSDVTISGDQRLILLSPDGTKWKVLVDNAGVLSASTL